MFGGRLSATPISTIYVYDINQDLVYISQISFSTTVYREGCGFDGVYAWCFGGTDTGGQSDIDA